MNLDIPKITIRALAIFAILSMRSDNLSENAKTILCIIVLAIMSIIAFWPIISRRDD